MHKLLVDGVRAIQHRRQRQGKKGRQKRRGRPRKQAQQQTQYRQGLRKKAQAAFLWEPQHLMVRQQADLRKPEKQNLALRWKIAPALTLVRPCNQQLYRLLEPGMTQPWARSRRTRLVNKPLYQANAFLAKALKKMSQAKCDKMIVLRGWENGQRTNHQVERHNRVVRMMQKTRYKRRKPHTIAKALELELDARMLEPPLYLPKIRALPIRSQETTILTMAA